MLAFAVSTRGPRTSVGADPAAGLRPGRALLNAPPVRLAPGEFALRDTHGKTLATFGSDGVGIRIAGVQLGLRVTGYGYNERMFGVGREAPRARANRVTYGHGPLAEWYAAEPDGIEQGFTLVDRPGGSRSGWLTLAMRVSGAHAMLSPRGDAIILGGAHSAVSYGALAATDSRGRRLETTLTLAGDVIRLRVDDRDARYPLRIDPLIQSAPASDPYAQAVLADHPAMYLRLDEPGGAIASDSSGNGNDATYEPGMGFGVTGPLASVPSDAAVGWPDTGVGLTQSGATLPSGNSARTVEFWWRTVNCQAAPLLQYGGPASGNQEFQVVLDAGNCSASRLDLNTGGQGADWSLPAGWDDGAWHLFDVTYDGAIATGYVDGQIVGSATIATPLATVTPGNGFSISDYSGHPDKPDDIAELAVYPRALTPTQIDAHWTAAAVTSCPRAPTDPYGQGVVANAPSLYFRLGDLVTDPADRIAYDSSGHCTTSAPANGAYVAGTGPEPDGVSLGYATGAVNGGIRRHPRS